LPAPINDTGALARSLAVQVNRTQKRQFYLVTHHKKTGTRPGSFKLYQTYAGITEDIYHQAWQFLEAMPPWLPTIRSSGIRWLVSGGAGRLEITQELILRIQYDHIPFAAKGYLVGLHATVDLIEVLILAEVFGMPLGPDCSPSSLGPLGFGKSLGQNQSAPTICVGPSSFGRLITPAAKLL